MLGFSRPRLFGCTAALGAATLSVVAASAQPAPVTPEFRVNSYTTGVQDAPRSCRLANGDVMVVWQSRNQLGASARDVFGQRFRFDGSAIAVGTEFRANSHTTDNQDDPDVACGPGGEFVVVWEATAQDGDGNGVFGQLFSSSGMPAGTGFRANAFTTLDQQDPAVAMDSNGGFVVVWESLGQDGNATGVFGRRFNNVAAATSAEFRVNGYVTGVQQDPDVATTSDGSFVVAWEGAGPDGGLDADVFVRRLGSDGAPFGTEIRLNSQSAGAQANPAVAAFAGGGSIVAWQSNGQDGDNDGIFARRLSATAAPQGPEFQVNAYITGAQDNPDVSVDPDDNFIVVWESFGQDLSGNAAVGRLHDRFATPVGDEFRANTFSVGSQDDVTVAGGKDGFEVMWTSAEALDGSLEGIFARRFSLLVAPTTTTPPPTTTTLVTTTTTLPGTPACADADDDGRVSASDALQALRAAVGLVSCEMCRCDVDASMSIVASDALLILQLAVALPVTVNCVAC